MQKQEPKTVSGQIKNPPFHSGKWNRKRLCLLLTELCYYDTEPAALEYFSRYRQDPALCGMLLSVLADKTYEGSDVQMGAARILSQMHPDVLCGHTKELLALQADPVVWKRPFPDGLPDWINASEG